MSTLALIIISVVLGVIIISLLVFIYAIITSEY